MGHLVWWLSMMTLWAGFKQQHSASDGIIGPNEAEDQSGIAQIFSEKIVMSTLHLHA